MSWPIRLIATPTNDIGDDGVSGYGRLAVGDMWPAPYLLTETHRWQLAPNYFRDWEGKRAPLVVKMPDGSSFCVDDSFWKGGERYGDGWIVTGDAPNITLAPSVNLVGSYHGFIQNGVIGDDVEGRIFLPR